MADSRLRLSSIPPRLLEDNSGLKGATPRRGLAEVRNTPLQTATADKKTARAFAAHTPSRLENTFTTPFSNTRKTNRTLKIYEDPGQSEAASVSTEKKLILESVEEMDSCERDPTKDEETLEEAIGMMRMEEVVLVENEKTSLIDNDDDTKTLVFGYDEDDLSIYSISSDEEEEEDWTEDEESSGGVGEYFFCPHNLAIDFNKQWESLHVDAHESDTEIDHERGYDNNHRSIDWI